MKISFNWLKDYIDTDLPVEDVSRILTDTGLEVEGVHDFESVKGGLKGFLLGEVKEVSKHPDADRLNCTKVDVGSGELLDIVCGAPNVAQGQKVAVAMVGCEIHLADGNSFAIKKSKIRGQVSEGMLCAEDELGLGEGHDGIMVLDTELPLGTPLAEVIDIYSDKVIEIGLTPNRSDAISHIGVARDLAAVLNLEKPTQISWPEVNIPKVNGKTISVEVLDPESCPRYTGIELVGITVAPSPDWLQNKLKSLGLSPINNVVDITNFVMHETGQPLHAFDREKIGGQQVKVRKALPGEKFVTLDEVERELHVEDLMIADAEKSMCIAGVFGGLESGVSESTTSIFLESAVFDAVSVRKSNKRHGLSTDSGFRFERGVDPNNPLYALQRAAQLICQVVGASVTSEITDIYPKKVEPLELDFDLEACFRLIGQEIPVDEVKTILTSLDIEVLAANGSNWKLRIPTYRVDVTRQADVVEEVLRIYGFNRIAMPEQLRNSIVHSPGPDKHGAREKLSLLLNGMGYTEIMCNSLTSVKHAALLDKGEETAVHMLNPLSQDLGILRQTMLWGALESIAYNQNRQMADMKGFELGSVYFKDAKGYTENERLSIFHTGRKAAENWDVTAADTSFYDLSAVIDAVLDRFDLSDCKRSDSGSELYAQGLEWKKGDRPVASAGIVSDTVRKHFDVKQAVYFADIDWVYITGHAHGKKMQVREIPKFPAVRRDFSLLLDKNVEFQHIEELAHKSAGPLLKEVGLFDVYEGKNLPEGKKSYAVSFQIQDENKTLTDKVVDKLMNKIQQRLEKELGASLRG
jgi:phenylalanyl-tRNA synthetase beta chain